MLCPRCKQQHALGAACELIAGARAGDYELLRELGRGAWGVVFLARHRASGLEVALKLLHRHLAQDAGTVRRLAREARFAGELGPTLVANVLGHGEQSELGPWLAMEHLHGDSLFELARQRVSAEESLRLLALTADTLGVAHARQVLHGSLRPTNVFRLHSEGRPGTVVFLPFGVSLRESDEDRDIEAIGSAEFRAPEQTAGEPPDIRMDVYSLGALAYLLATGRFPFTAPTPQALERAHLEVVPIAPHRVNPRISRGWSLTIMKALEKAPESRFQTMEEFAQALREAPAAPDPVGTTTGMFVRPPSLQKQGPGVVVLGGDGDEVPVPTPTPAGLGPITAAFARAAAPPPPAAPPIAPVTPARGARAASPSESIAPAISSSPSGLHRIPTIAPVVSTSPSGVHRAPTIAPVVASSAPGVHAPPTVAPVVSTSPSGVYRAPTIAPVVASSAPGVHGPPPVAPVVSSSASGLHRLPTIAPVVGAGPSAAQSAPAGVPLVSNSPSGLHRLPTIAPVIPPASSGSGVHRALVPAAVAGAEGLVVTAGPLGGAPVAPSPSTGSESAAAPAGDLGDFFLADAAVPVAAGLGDFTVAEAKPAAPLAAGLGDFTVAEAKPAAPLAAGLGDFTVSEVKPAAPVAAGLGDFTVSEAKPAAPVAAGLGDFTVTEAKPIAAESDEGGMVVTVGTAGATKPVSAPARPFESTTTPPPGGSSPSGISGLVLRVGVTDERGQALGDFSCSAVTRSGLVVVTTGPLPALLGKVKLTFIDLDGLHCDAQVVQHITAEQAAQWKMSPGFGVAFSALTPEQRARIEQAQQRGVTRIPDTMSTILRRPDDPVAAETLARFAPERAADGYAMLGLSKAAPFDAIRDRLRDTVKALEDLADRPLSAAQLKALAEAKGRVEALGQTLLEPGKRIVYDAERGNFEGVARCINGGVSVAEVEAARTRFLEDKPGLHGKSQGFLLAGQTQEARQQLAQALQTYAELLKGDPLNLTAQQRYWSVRRQLE